MHLDKSRSTAKPLIGGLSVLALIVQPALVTAHEDNPDQPAGHTQRVLELVNNDKVTFGAGLTVVSQGMSGNTDDASLTYSVDLGFTGDFGERGTAFIYFNTAQGAGIDTGAATGANADDETGTLSVDGEGFSDTRVAEAWYEFPLSESAALRLGKIDPTGIYDGNEIANDETTQFLADAFVNNPAIAFPGYAAGINLRIAPSDKLSFNIGAFESSADFDGSLASAFVIGEVAMGYELAGRIGHARLNVWSEDTTDNKGYALNLDQSVSDNITLFARYGKQDEQQDFDQAFSLGGQLALGGNAVGLGYSLLSTTGSAGPDDESQLELYYSHTVNDNLHLTLDLQSVNNPGFNSANDDVFVYGLRGQIDF